MSKQQFIEPTIAVEADSTITHNVVSSTPGGAVQVVTTEETVVTHEADRHIVAGDMLIGPGHHKHIPTDLYVTGDVKVDAKDAITIGDDTIRYNGLLEINGILASGGDVDVLGDLVFTDSPIDSDNFGIKNGSADFTGWTLVDEGSYHHLYQKQITFIVPFVDDKYTVMLQPVNYPNPAGGGGASHPGYLFPINKTPNGFKIYVHTVPADLEYIDWVAMKY